ncbi:MAG: hypothetical protein NTU48_01390 [Legionellales bacterium]|nr:hypothetical protein [Legionellales bacterium]
MSNTDYEYGLRRQVTLTAEQRLKIALDRISQHLKKTQTQQKETNGGTTQQLALKLTPMSQTAHKNPINKEAVLRLSQHFRNTHLPNVLVAALQMPGPKGSTEQEKKLQAACDTFKKRWQLRRQQLKHDAAEQEYEHEHHLSP